MKNIACLLLLAFFATTMACGGDDEPANACETDGITYNNFVGDVLKNNCTFSGCHFSGNLAIGGLTTYDEASNFIAEAKMVSALRRKAGFVGMPQDTATGNPGTALPDCTIDKIEAWLAAGKPE